MKNPTLSLCMIVKNEEAVLDRCLKSVAGIVDEMIIVDTGSQDRTMEIAKSYQAIIYQHPWEYDFSSARNIGLEKASSDWILMLDADEELPEQTRSLVKDTLLSCQSEGITMLQRNLQSTDSLSLYYDLRTTRIYRNSPQYRYEQPIHEQIRPTILRNGGSIIDTDMFLIHYGYISGIAQGNTNRASRNLQMLIQFLKQNPQDPYIYYQIGVTYLAMGDRNIGTSWLLKTLSLDYQTLGPEAIDNIYMKLAQQMLGFEDYDKAIVYAQKSLEINPNNLISLYVLGLSFLYKGQMADAYPIFIQIRGYEQLNPTAIPDLDKVILHCKSLDQSAQ